MELCPFCGAELPDEHIGVIDAINFECPSGCDIKVKVSVTCESCGRVYYARWIYADYARELEKFAIPFLTFKEIYEQNNCSVPEVREADFEVRDGKLYLLDEEIFIIAEESK